MGVILLFFVLGGLGLRSYIVSSDSYARDTIPRLFKTWDRDALRRELNVEKFSDADVDHIADLGAKAFGGLQSFSLHRATFSSVKIGGRSYVRMCYAVPGRFDKKLASFKFYIANINRRWQIVEFDVGDVVTGNNIFKPLPAHLFGPPRTKTKP